MDFAVNANEELWYPIISKDKTRNPPKQETTSAGEDVEKLTPSGTVGGNVKRCGHCGKEDGGSSKN